MQLMRKCGLRSSKGAIIEVTYDAIGNILKMPGDIHVVEIFNDSLSFQRQTIYLRVAGDDLPEDCQVREGERYPWVVPIYNDAGEFVEFSRATASEVVNEPTKIEERLAIGKQKA